MSLCCDGAIAGSDTVLQSVSTAIMYNSNIPCLYFILRKGKSRKSSSFIPKYAIIDLSHIEGNGSAVYSGPSFLDSNLSSRIITPETEQKDEGMKETDSPQCRVQSQSSIGGPEGR